MAERSYPSDNIEEGKKMPWFETALHLNFFYFQSANKFDAVKDENGFHRRIAKCEVGV